MMKKLLVIFTMLAAISNAAILELSVNGVTNGDGVDQAITLNPSDTVMIDVYLSGDEDTAPWTFYVEYDGPISPEGLGTIYSPPAVESTVSYYTYYDWTTIYFSPTGSTAVDPEIGKWWETSFHCDGPGAASIVLWDSTGYVVLDTVTVTQLPEPMTIALLGLGGLFLRRRK
jgi:hypothetical protein